MDNKEIEKLNTEELDQAAGGSVIDDAINTFNKGIGIVKTTKDAALDAALQAGEAVLNTVKDKVRDPFGLSKSPVQKHQDDSYKFGE